MDRSRRAQQVALGSLLVGALICLGKLVVGILTGSLGLLSEAAHSGFDVVASGFALVAVRTARRPADEDHLYGHGRAENLAAYTEGLVLLVTADGIAVEAVRRPLGGVSGVREIRGIRVRRSGGRLLADARVSTRRTLSVVAAERLTERV